MCEAQDGMDFTIFQRQNARKATWKAIECDATPFAYIFPWEPKGLEFGPFFLHIELQRQFSPRWLFVRRISPVFELNHRWWQVEHKAVGDPFQGFPTTLQDQRQNSHGQGHREGLSYTAKGQWDSHFEYRLRCALPPRQALQDGRWWHPAASCPP